MKANNDDGFRVFNPDHVKKCVKPTPLSEVWETALALPTTREALAIQRIIIADQLRVFRKKLRDDFGEEPPAYRNRLASSIVADVVQDKYRIFYYSERFGG